MKRAPPTNYPAQRLGLEQIAGIFRIDENNTVRQRREALAELEADHHLTELCMQTIRSSLGGGGGNATSTAARSTSLACRVLAWMCDGSERDVADALVKASAVAICVAILQEFGTLDPSCARGAMSLIICVCDRARSRLGREQLRRTPQAANTLYRILRKWDEHAPTVELALSVTAWLGEYAISNLCAEVVRAGSSHPTDTAVIKSALSACASMSFKSETNRVCLVKAGILRFARACLEYRPAHQEVACLVAQSVANVMQSPKARSRFEFEGADHRRLTSLICSLLPQPNSVDTDPSLVKLLRSTTSAITMISLTGDPIREYIQEKCGVALLLQEILDGRLPSIRARMDTEFCLEIVNGKFGEANVSAFGADKLRRSRQTTAVGSQASDFDGEGDDGIVPGYLESHTGRKMRYLPRPTPNPHMMEAK